MKKEYIIEVIVVEKDNPDVVICKRSSYSFEGAEEDLGKLERFIKAEEKREQCLIKD